MHILNFSKPEMLFEFIYFVLAYIERVIVMSENWHMNIQNNETQHSWFPSKFSFISSFTIPVLSKYGSTLISDTTSVSFSYSNPTLP